MLTPDERYAVDLRVLETRLRHAALRACARGIDGLEDSLLAAAESARSWADTLAPEPTLANGANGANGAPNGPKAQQGGTDA